MLLDDLLTPAGVIHHLPVSSAANLLDALADRAATLVAIDAATIRAAIAHRETLGSTGFGGGTAIPHARLHGLDHIVTLVAQLAEPVDFAALDGQPVDLVVLLLAPADPPPGHGADHLKALARVSRLLRDGNLLAKLRASSSADALYALLIRESQSRAA